MKKAARQQQIVARLAESPAIRISHLANALGVSTETVRRDVDELTRRGVDDRLLSLASTAAIAGNVLSAARRWNATKASAAVAISTGSPMLNSEKRTPATESARIHTVTMNAPAKKPLPIVHIREPADSSRDA